MPVISNVMRLEANDSLLAVRITEVIPLGQQRAGDLRFECSASVKGFTGLSHGWIDAEHMKEWASTIRRLYESLDGVAVLESMSPGELRISVEPKNPRGYVTVRVEVASFHPTHRAMKGEFELALPDLRELVEWSESAHGTA